ncbi:hypothetical protein Musp01_20110 [Muricauda sp. NBRC 101325]|nr:hypothetical protein Musp01_20110 [Muricauda sp. NBRC 101325]
MYYKFSVLKTNYNEKGNQNNLKHPWFYRFSGNNPIFGGQKIGWENFRVETICGNFSELWQSTKNSIEVHGQHQVLH